MQYHRGHELLVKLSSLLQSHGTYKFFRLTDSFLAIDRLTNGKTDYFLRRSLFSRISERKRFMYGMHSVLPATKLYTEKDQLEIYGMTLL